MYVPKTTEECSIRTFLKFTFVIFISIKKFPECFTISFKLIITFSIQWTKFMVTSRLINDTDKFITVEFFTAPLEVNIQIPSFWKLPLNNIAGFLPNETSFIRISSSIRTSSLFSLFTSRISTFLMIMFLFVVLSFIFRLFPFVLLFVISFSSLIPCPSFLFIKFIFIKTFLRMFTQITFLFALVYTKTEIIPSTSEFQTTFAPIFRSNNRSSISMETDTFILTKFPGTL